jgi:HPr kinase/phosphorylase
MTLKVRDLIEDYDLELISGEQGMDREVTKAQVSRPGIELAGLFDFYEFDRVQVFGSKEVTFFWWLNTQDQEIRVDMLFQKRPPMFVFSQNINDIPEIFIRKGHEYGIVIAKAQKKTVALVSSLYQYLSAKLSPRLSLHGTLLDISGVGVLIRGKSGLGKSEVALELVRRGHQLVADDRVDIYQRELGVLVGEAPEILQKYLEIRGIGIVNVVQLFGARAFKENKKIMLIIDLEPWNTSNNYDRLGLEHNTLKLFETDVHHITIPVSEGRNVATLVEAAAVNARLKYMGVDSAKEFTDSLDQELARKNKEKE